MNSLERVTLALNHKEADRVPVYPLINSISRKYLDIGYDEWTKDVKKCAESIIKATDEIDVDVICTLVDLSVEAADWGMELKYSKNKAAGPAKNKHLITCKEDYHKIDVLNPRETKRMSEHIELAHLLYEAKGQEKPIVGFVFGPLGILSMMTGLDNLCIDMFVCPNDIKVALRNITETLKEFVSGLIDAGCHAVMFDTLYASRTIMSPEMWDEFEGVYIEELCDHTRAKGGMVMLHNCGNGVYFEQQIKRMDPIAISYQHLPPDCKDLAEIKEKYGKKVTLIGHVEPGWLLTATEDEVRAKCREQIDAYKADGGFILATGCEYPAPLDDTLAKIMVEEAKIYGKY
ncbi:uroporphyrinogen decarboxylase family protein [Eubacteriaceae bacterium ES2]|nr:uroporphyrinogen decarboxylase family protein [Eubacteriaceae bacterium ES2]